MVSAKRIWIVVWLLLAGCLSCWGAEAPVPFIRYNDRVVFFGDSITAIGVFTVPMSSFFLLQYPEYHVTTLRNAGVPGNTAQDGFKRLQQDVLDQSPTVVLTCFGINEMRAAPRDPKTLETYLATMTQIVQALKKAPRIRQILLSPPCVDQQDGAGNAIWYKTPDDAKAANAMVGQMTDGLRALSEREGVPFCDLFHPMLEMQAKMKAATPGWTMLPDGIHPNYYGGTVMAATILNSMHCTRPAGSVALDAATGEVTAENCTVIDVQVSPRRVSFTRTDTALPIAMLNAEHGEQARIMPALHALPEFQEWNRYPLRVTGLPAGRWRLAAPGNTDLGTYTAVQWATGIDLSPAMGPWTEIGILANWLEGKKQERWSFLENSLRKVERWPLTDAQRADASELKGQFIDAALQEDANSRYLLVDVTHRTSTWVLTRVDD